MVRRARKTDNDTRSGKIDDPRIPPGCQVVVYAGPVSPHGSSPLFIKDSDSKIPWYGKILPDSKPKNFFPRVDKK